MKLRSVRGTTRIRALVEREAAEVDEEEPGQSVDIVLVEFERGLHDPIRRIGLERVVRRNGNARDTGPTGRIVLHDGDASLFVDQLNPVVGARPILVPAES